MLTEATKNAAWLHRGNVEFAFSDDELSMALGAYDWVNSYIVLQHIPPSRGMPIIRQLLKRVALGGGCLIHMSVQRSDSLLKCLAYWTRFHVLFGTPLINLLRSEDIGRRSMQMNEYPLPVLVRAFREAGMSEFFAVSENHGEVPTLSLISRRPR